MDHNNGRCPVHGGEFHDAKGAEVAQELEGEHSRHLSP